MVKKTTPKSSQSAANQPSGEITVELPYPKIRYAANNSILYPIDAIDGTVATIAFSGMDASPVTLHWAIKGQDKPGFDPIVQMGSTSASIEIAVPWQWVSTCIGHTVLIWYTAMVGGELKESLVLELEIQHIREADLRESLPVFAHAHYVHSTWQLDMKLFSDDETIKVKAWPMIQAKQRLFIKVECNQGTPPLVFTWVVGDHEVTAAEANAEHVFEFKLSRSWMAGRADYSALTIQMAVIFDGTDPKPAVLVPTDKTPLPENGHEFHPRTTALLIVDRSLRLPVPILVEAEGLGQVDPLKLLEGATVRVCYEGMRNKDDISLCWESTFGDCAPIASQYGVEQGCIDFHIPPLYVGMRLDNFANFSYTVTREGEQYRSPKGQVRILLPANLPRPQILEAPFNTLDLGQMCCDDPVTIYVAPWPFIGITQVIQLYIGGVYPDGSKARLYPFDNEPITEEDVRNGWTRTLPRAELAALKHGSELYILLSVEFLPRTESRPVYRPFPSLLVNLLTEPHLELPAPHLVESVDCGDDGWVLNPVNTVKGAHIQVAYERMCHGDRVCPTFIGTPGPGSPALECHVVAEGEQGLVFQVSPAAISANFWQKISLSYSVWRSCGGFWESPEQEVQILDVSGLPTPAVEQATGSTLDLNTFAADATVTVGAWLYIALGQSCWLWVTGILEDGSAYSFAVLEGKLVTEEWLANGVDTPLPRDELQKLADCRDFEVHFAVNFNGQSDKASAKAFPPLVLHIVQKDLDLDAPTVREAVGEQLTIWNGRDGVTVRVEYERISPNHMISVQWLRHNGTPLPLEPKPGNSGPGYVDFSIPREAVIHSAGKTVLIHSTVTSACKLASSKTLPLQISVPVHLPTPVVQQATNGILDLRAFTGDAYITVEKWWFILLGQVGWLECRGIAENGSLYTIKVSVAEPITQSELLDGLRKLLKRTELEKLRNDTQLVIAFKATPDVGGVVGNAIGFVELALQFRKALYDHTDFNPDDKDWNGWQRGPGAADPRDLKYKPGAVPGSASGHYLEDWGYTNTSNPVTQRVKLFKDFSALDPGRTYKFSAWIRDIPMLANRPRLVIVAQGQEISPITLPGAIWQLLQGTFRANSSTARLSLDNLQMGSGPGNDFDVTGMTVEEV